MTRIESDKLFPTSSSQNQPNRQLQPHPPVEARGRPEPWKPHGKDLETAVNWGAAHGMLVQEIPGDITMVNQAAVEAEVKRAAAGGGVKATR